MAGDRNPALLGRIAANLEKLRPDLQHMNMLQQIQRVSETMLLTTIFELVAWYNACVKFLQETDVPLQKVLMDRAYATK